MDLLNGIRYVVALWMAAFLPPAILFWLAIHPFVHFWRGIGVAATYWILIPLMLVMTAVVFWYRAPVMAVDFGFQWPLAVPGAILFAVGLWVDRQAKRHLRFRTLAGVPELKGSGEEQTILRDGVYARIRHPRYVGITVNLVGTALLTNYLVGYLLVVFTLLTLWAVTVLEERELVERFGDEYRRYQAAVPRFVPRRSGVADGAAR
jgi:protein-S-isoprenylcysteine O-methyltransferase Ste14